MAAQLVALQSAPDLVERVHRALLDAISDASLPPGARLRQEEIAEQLAVSRQPVLQALRLLKKDGFVHDAPGRGLMVAPLDVGWMRNVYQVRGALDTLAARLAAERRWVIDPKLIEHGRKCARGRNIKAMVDADMAFHNAIYAGSNNPLIEPSAGVHWDHLRRVMGEVLQSSRQRSTVWDEHEAISAAIARGNVARAVQLIEEHSAAASEHLAGRLTQVLKSIAGEGP
jgi:DNA-binding GntR family transcriptional regulator